MGDPFALADPSTRVNARAPRRGENQQATAAGLDLLRVLGWLVLHDVAVPGDPENTIDHVLAGPSGVYVVDTAAWSGAIAVDEGLLRSADAHRAADLAAVSAAANGVRELLGGTPVAALLCLERSDEVAGVVGDVALCSTENILDLLTSQARILDDQTLATATRTLGSRLRSLPSAGPQAPVVLAPVPAEPVTVEEEPVEVLVYQGAADVAELVALVEHETHAVMVETVVVETVEIAEPVELIEPVDWIEPVESVEMVESTEPVDSVELVEAPAPAPSTAPALEARAPAKPRHRDSRHRLRVRRRRAKRTPVATGTPEAPADQEVADAAAPVEAGDREAVTERWSDPAPALGDLGIVDLTDAGRPAKVKRARLRTKSGRPGKLGGRRRAHVPGRAFLHVALGALLIAGVIVGAPRVPHVVAWGEGLVQGHSTQVGTRVG